MTKKSIQSSIAEMQSVLNNPKTSESTKKTLKASIEKAKKQLAEIEEKERQKKTAKPKKITLPKVKAAVKVASKQKASAPSVNKAKNLARLAKKYGVTGTTNLKIDAERPAKAIGKRIAKSGKKYYEYRENRIDRRQPPKRYPKLRDGGDIEGMNEYQVTLHSNNPQYQNEQGFGENPPIIFTASSAFELMDELKTSLPNDTEVVSVELLQPVDMMELGGVSGYGAEREDGGEILPLNQGLNSDFRFDIQSEQFADGGGVERYSSSSLEAIRKKYDDNRMRVRFKIGALIGIDNALKYMEREYSVHPIELIEMAVNKGFITIDEIDNELWNAAVSEAEHVTDMYRDSGEGIGSSDLNAFISNMLNDAGIKVVVKNGRFEREDKMAHGGMMAKGGRVMDDVDMYLEIHGYYPESVMALRGDGIGQSIVRGDRSKFELSGEDYKKAEEMGYEFDYYANGWVEKDDDDDYSKGGMMAKRGKLLSEKAKYIAKRVISEVKTKQGQTIKGSKLYDGVYAKK